MPDATRKALSEVAEIVMGQSPPGTTYNEHGKGLPFFQGKAEFGEVSPTAVKWCTDPRRTAERGDILMSVRAPVGPTNLATERCCIGRGLAAIRADATKLEPNYLRYFLRYSEQRLAGLGQGSTFSAIGRAEIASLRIPLPNLEDQRRIAELLSRAESIVRMRREAEQKAKEIIPALFLDMFGDPATNPKGWEVRPLGELISFVTSGSRGWAEHYSLSGARFVRSLDVRMNSISDEDVVYVNPPAGAEAERTRVQAGDVLLTITGSRIGRVAAVPDRLTGAYISQHVAILRLKRGTHPEFLSMFMTLKNGGQREITRLQYGQTKPGLNLNQIRQFLIPVPTLDLQCAFGAQAERIRLLDASQNIATQRSNDAFQSLLAGVFGGGEVSCTA